MIDTLRAEALKLRTIRAPWVLSIIAASFALAVTLLTMGLIRPEDISDDTLPSLIQGTSTVAILLVGVIGVICVAGEFTHGTARVTFVATPVRPRVLVAKVLVVAAYGLVIQAVILGVGWFGGAALARGGVTPHLDDLDGTVPGFVGLMLCAVGYAALGVAVGTLVRSQGGAISLMVLVPTVAEGLVYGLLSVIGAEGVAEHLPFRSAVAMTSVNPIDLEVGRVAGGVVFGIFTVVVVTLAGVTLVRRDV